MALKKKILIGYGVAFVVMGWVVVWAVANLVSLGQASNAILRENYWSILAAENMVDALERQDSTILLLFLGDPAKGIAQFRENETDRSTRNGQASCGRAAENLPGCDVSALCQGPRAHGSSMVRSSSAGRALRVILSRRIGILNYPFLGVHRGLFRLCRLFLCADDRRRVAPVYWMS
jgi:NtrC-family two-component system sensor histidine kinase KinB